MKSTVRLNFEFPREIYPYLKMICAKEGVSLREFATCVLVEAIEEYEDNLLAQEASKRLKGMDEKNLVSFSRAKKLAGWDDDK